MLLDLHSNSAEDTPALVIDFDHAEIRDKNDESKDGGNNSKKRQTVVCSCYLPVLCLAHHPTGDTHIHGPVSGQGSSSGSDL